jgi:uroporphyrin-3 C-methyltransferase
MGSLASSSANAAFAATFQDERKTLNDTAADQALILRENLKLRLLNARLALMARDQVTYRDELKVAYGWLEKHYAVADPAVQSALASLRQAAATNIQAEVPALTASLTALRNLRAGKEKR